MQEGADDYLVKPFSARELLARVDSHARIGRFRREAAERDRFRVAFGEALRPLADPREIEAEAVRALGEHLRASRVLFARAGAGEDAAVEWDGGSGFTSCAGRDLIGELPPALVDELRAGRAIVANDGAHPVAAVPLVEAGGRQAVLAVYRNEPRAWTGEEVALIGETAQRTRSALERARAEHARDDLLEREQAARREAERRAHATAAFTFVSDGVVLVDPDGVVRSWNPAAERVTGIAAEAAVGLGLQAVLPGWAQIADRVTVAAAAAEAPPRPASLPLRVGERELWLSVSATRFDAGVVYTFVDVSGERELERMRSELIATVSHELRTPLAAVYGAILTLRRDDLDLGTPKRAELLGMIETQARRLTTIVEEILLASRLEDGEVRIARVPSDPVPLAREIVEAARAANPGAEVTLLEPPAPIAPVVVDAEKVQQVLHNLLDNAVRYSGGEARIEVRVEAADGRLRFTVTDHGIGIPAGEQQRVFEKFYRLDVNMSDGVGGTGLGLYICRELARRMHGRLSLDSGPGRGAAFTLDIPTGRG